MTNTMFDILAGAVFVGFILAFVGIARFNVKAGVHDNGISSQIGMSSEQRQRQTLRLLGALYDRAQRVELLLILGGFALAILSFISMVVLSPTLPACSSETVVNGTTCTAVDEPAQ